MQNLLLSTWSQINYRLCFCNGWKSSFLEECQTRHGYSFYYGGRYLSCCETVNQAIWLKNFIMDLWVVDSITNHIQVFCDNNAAIFFLKEQHKINYNKKLRHQVSRWEKVLAGLVNIWLLGDKFYDCRPLNKPIPIAVFKKYIAMIGVLADFDAAE